MRKLTALNLALVVGLCNLPVVVGQEISILENPFPANALDTDAEELPAPVSEAAAQTAKTGDSSGGKGLKSILEVPSAGVVVSPPSDAKPQVNPPAAGARVPPVKPQPLESPRSLNDPTGAQSLRAAQPQASQSGALRASSLRDEPNQQRTERTPPRQATPQANLARSANRFASPVPGRPANVLVMPVRPVPMVVVGGRFGRQFAIPAPPSPIAPLPPAFLTGRVLAPAPLGLAPAPLGLAPAPQGLAPAPQAGGRGIFRRR